MAEAGHKFLAKLGKKRLRPGGKLATDWLIEQGRFQRQEGSWKLPAIWNHNNRAG